MRDQLANPQVRPPFQVQVEVTHMAHIEAPETRNGRQTDERVVEHMIIDEGETSECVLLPSDGDGEALATQWVAASEDSYVSLADTR